VRNEVVEMMDCSKLAIGIVVFREKYRETSSFISLVAALGQSADFAKFTIYVYDNTDDRGWQINQSEVSIPNRVSYIHNDTNAGISVAYNWIAKAATADGAEWILFLDQDTVLPVESIAIYLFAMAQHPSILIKCPQLLVNGSLFSPNRFWAMKSWPIEGLEPGVHLMKKFAIVNSGMLVRLDFFEELKGYAEDLRVDFADTEFIERAKEKTSEFELLPFQCNHSFSNDGSNKEAALFRFGIYATDLYNYPTKSGVAKVQLWLVGLAHAMMLMIRFRSVLFLSSFLKKAFSR
jgi:GT2 family glycosyltransferase